jgi:hypothetical protein
MRDSVAGLAAGEPAVAGVARCGAPSSCRFCNLHATFNDLHWAGRTAHWHRPCADYGVLSAVYRDRSPGDTVLYRARYADGRVRAVAPATLLPAFAKGSGEARRSASREGGGFDVLACPRCAGRLRLVALIEAAGLVRRILEHLGVAADVPLPRPGRAPPLPAEVHGARDWHDQPGFEFDT